MSINERIILHTGGQTCYNFYYTDHISVDLAHHDIFHAKFGKDGIMQCIIFDEPSVFESCAFFYIFKKIR